MSMRLMSRRSRVLTRCAISAAAVACPLAAATAAQAAIAGALPPTLTIAPDLRSVSLVAPNEAVFCFDKPLANGTSFDGSKFELAGYNSLTARTATGGASTVKLDVGNKNCVVATFDPLVAGSSSAELKDYSIGTVLTGAVTGNAGGTSLADSVPETNSTSHSGTAGVTTAPNLVSVTADPSLQQIDFVFDRAVDPTTVNSFDFCFVDAAGTFHLGTGTATVVNGNQVDVGGFVGSGGASADVRTATVAGTSDLDVPLAGSGGLPAPVGPNNASGSPESIAPAASLPIPGTSRRRLIRG